TPCRIAGSWWGSANRARSPWTWASMNPGATTRPAASMRAAAAARERSPTAAIRPPATPTSARNQGSPVPSTTRPPAITTSNIWAALSSPGNGTTCTRVAGIGYSHPSPRTREAPMAKSRKPAFVYDYPRPALTVDVALVSRDEPPKVLLIRRLKEPFAGRWALPGGFVDENEPLAAAARRALREET